MNDEFYIGYEESPPAGLKRLLIQTVCILVGVIIVLMAALAASQTPAEPGSYEFGVSRPFEGLLIEAPIPLLQTVSPSGAVTNYVLVGAGKKGLPPFARGHSGQHVRFNASRIQQGNTILLELNDEKSFTQVGIPQEHATSKPTSSDPKTSPSVTLVGELVDTKCYFGVMRPGAGKVHRGCAVRCLSGGVPPGLLVRDSTGGCVVYLLAGAGGKSLPFDVQWAGRWVKATGKISDLGNATAFEVSRLDLAYPEQAPDALQ